MNFSGLMLVAAGAISGFSIALAHRFYTVSGISKLKRIVGYQVVAFLLVVFLLLSGGAFPYSDWSHIPAFVMRLVLLVLLPGVTETFMELARVPRTRLPRWFKAFPATALISHLVLIALFALLGVPAQTMERFRGTLFLALIGLFHVGLAVWSYYRRRMHRKRVIEDTTTRILITLTTVLPLLFSADLLRGPDSFLRRFGLNPDTAIVIVLLVTEISLARVHFVWIYNQITEKRDAIARLTALKKEHRRLAYIDALTGLPNMNSFHFYMQRKFGNASWIPFSYLLVSIDQFMEIVSNAGIDQGTRILQRSADLLTEVFGSRVRIFRMHDEQFAIVLPRRTDSILLDMVCGNLVSRFEQGIDLGDGIRQNLSVSIGVVPVPRKSISIGELRQRSILALREAQGTGNNWVVFDNSLKNTSSVRFGYYNAIRDSIEKKLFHLVYQPIVDTDGTIIKAEALLRSRHPDLEDVSPAIWIPIAEQTELIHATSVTTWDLALEAAGELENQDIRTRISVNLSQKALERTAFRNRILESLEKEPAADGLVCVEITETAMMSGRKDMAEFLGQLRDRGVEVLLDDFGTGYSSLAYLKELPIDTVKLDRRFIRNIEEDSQDQVFCRNILDLTDHLKMGTVAEGIETEGAFRLLRSMGCRNFQGWHFGRPGELEDLVSRVKNTVPAASS